MGRGIEGLKMEIWVGGMGNRRRREIGMKTRIENEN